MKKLILATFSSALLAALATAHAGGKTGVDPTAPQLSKKANAAVTSAVKPAVVPVKPTQKSGGSAPLKPIQRQGLQSNGTDVQGSDIATATGHDIDPGWAQPGTPGDRGRSMRATEPLMHRTGIESNGTDFQGTDLQGTDMQGTDAQGMDTQGIDPQGFDPQGMDPQGVDPQGMDSQGLDSQGVDGQGVDSQGMPAQGTDVQGVDGQGIDAQGVDAQGTPTQAADARAADVQTRKAPPTLSHQLDTLSLQGKPLANVRVVEGELTATTDSQVSLPGR